MDDQGLFVVPKAALDDLLVKLARTGLANQVGAALNEFVSQEIKAPVVAIRQEIGTGQIQMINIPYNFKTEKGKRYTFKVIQEVEDEPTSDPYDQLRDELAEVVGYEYEVAETDLGMEWKRNVVEAVLNKLREKCLLGSTWESGGGHVNVLVDCERESYPSDGSPVYVIPKRKDAE